MTDALPPTKDGSEAERAHGKQLDRFRATKPTQPRNTTRMVLWGVGVLILLGLCWLGITAFATYQKVSDPASGSSPFLKYFGQTIDPTQVKGEGDGRINVLFIGVGGANHKGGTLADTIMVASIDPVNKKLALLSIPRDLRVSFPGGGAGKINSVHAYAEKEESGTGPQALKDTVSKVLDLPLHYYVRVDFAGFEQAIDALGGVTIDVPKALNDPLFPDEALEGYDPFSVKAGVQEMDGETALKYARSRETTSDFDRAARQQIILLAVRDELMSANTLANPKKIGELIGIVGDHVRMDLSITDLQHLLEIVQTIDQSQVVTKVLDNSATGPLKSISDGGYYLVPKAGNFSEVQRIAHELFTDPNLTKEQAKIEILNGTGEAGSARELQLDLQALGYTIISIDKTDTTPTTVLTDYSGGKVPFTARFLSERLGLPVTATLRPAGTAADLRLVLGQDYKPVNLTP
ncbi:MAG: LCP family protein [Patescibacteria group bacterium]